MEIPLLIIHIIADIWQGRGCVQIESKAARGMYENIIKKRGVSSDG